MLDEKIKKSFCVAPWIHAHVTANGQRRLCCMADPAPAPYAQMPWTEFKNSAYMKEARQKMLSGELPKACGFCATSNRIDTYRDDLNSEHKEKISAILNSTAADGSTDMPVSYLDYRTSLCNLKCRTCSPDASSTYQSFIAKQNEALVNTLFKNNFTKSPVNSEKFSAELTGFVENDNLDRIYFAGGEPLLDPAHFPFLQSLIKEGRAQNIYLVYNTNLTLPESKLKLWLELLKNFKSCSIFISIDGHDKVCDYIREGLVFEKLNSNIELLRSLVPPHWQVALDITLTSLNLFFLEDFAAYALQKNLPVVSKFIFRTEQTFPLLHTEAIRVREKELLIARWRAYFESLSPSEQHLLANLNNTVQLFKERVQWTDANEQDHVKKLLLYESMYPEKARFIDLLAADEVGKIWAEALSIQ